MIKNTYVWTNIGYYELTTTGITPLGDTISTNLSRTLSAVHGAGSEPVGTLQNLTFTRTVANTSGIEIDVIEEIPDEGVLSPYRDDHEVYNLLKEFDYLSYWRHPSGRLCVILLKDNLETLLALTDTLEKLSKIKAS